MTRLFSILSLAFLVLTCIGFETCYAAQDSGLPSSNGGRAQSSFIAVVTSPSHPAVADAAANSERSQILEWSETTGTLTAKVTYSKTSVNTAKPDDQVFFLPFPTVILDAHNNLVAERAFQANLVLGHLEESHYGLHVVLRNDIHLSVQLLNDKLSVSIVSNPTAS